MIRRNGKKVSVAPADWNGRAARVGQIEDGVLHNQSNDVLGFAKSMGVSSEVIDNAGVLGFHTVRFQWKERGGQEWVGDVPVAEILKCPKDRVQDWPECYYVPLDKIEVTGKKPVASVEMEESKSKKA